MGKIAKAAKMALHIDLTEVTYALSDALDLVGVKVVQHGKRVAFMALECGRACGWGDDDLVDLFHASLLHDCGVSSTAVHWKLVTRLEWEEEAEHCATGYELLRGFAPFARLAQMILYHHTHWNAGDHASIPADIALLSNCIHLADRTDALMLQHRGSDLLLDRGKIQDAVAGLSGTFFSPQLVDGFLRASAPEAFWLTLEPHHLDSFMQEQLGKVRGREISFDQLKELARIFAKIVDAKSRFTAEHSAGVARLARFLGERSGLSQQECELLEVAGLVHDLGKLRVPDSILDKPAPLDEREFATIERHAFETYQILKRITVLREAAEWAAFHHEALSGRGYPFHRQGGELSLPARIMAVADVFQALAQNRPYRQSLPKEQILKELEAMARRGKLDPALVALVAANLDACWHAALG